MIIAIAILRLIAVISAIITIIFSCKYFSAREKYKELNQAKDSYTSHNIWAELVLSAKAECNKLHSIITTLWIYTAVMVVSTAALSVIEVLTNGS